MKALLDSSTLVAAMLPDHAHHEPALPWLSQAKIGAYDLVISGHSLAEVYAVLTRLPRIPPVSSADAWKMLKENVLAYGGIITLSGDDYVALMEDLSQRNITGGQVYDAIIAKAAELAQVDQLVTLNESHFQKVWPGGVTRIVSPLSAVPPSA
jgi:predicted nucleic acid-binding protein